MKTRDFIYTSKTTKIMKTGGTMNFLKKAGAILLLVAVFASSCNKYADDFKQLNTKLDALAAQVAGVTQLSTDITALKAQVTALQTAVAALPTTTSVNAGFSALTAQLTATTAKIDIISTNLNTLAASAATKTDLTTATTNIMAGVHTDLMTQLAVTNKAIADAQTALLASNTQQTKDVQAAIIANNTALQAQIQTQLNALQLALTGKPTDTDPTALTIQALQLQLKIENAKLDQILANSAMYNGDVNITTPAEVTFWSKKINVLAMINGNLTINTTTLTAKLDSVNYITKNIQTVLGSTAGVKNKVTVTSVANATVLDLSHLTSVSGDYTVTGVKINDSNLMGVGGNFLVNFDGPYAYPNLSNVAGNLTLTKVTKAAPAVGTTSINLPMVTVVGSVFDGVGGAGVLVYPDATSVILSGGVVNLTAAVATQVTLGSTAYPAGLVVSAPTAAAVVDLSAATSGAGAISVTTGNGGTVKFTKLASAAGGVTVNTGTSGTVDFSALATAAGGVNLTGPATVTFPVLVSGALTSDATTVTLPKHEWAIPAVLSKVVTLTLGNVNASVNLDSYNTTLVSASVSGKAQTTWAATAGAVATTASAKLTTLTLGGNLGTANLSGLTVLTSLTTSGQINFFTVNGATVLTAMNLGHTYYQPGNVAFGGPGSDLVITNNPALTALKSSGDYPRNITITGNGVLASLDLSSYHTKLLAAAGATTTITINTNALVGDYTNAVAITPTTPYAETVIKSADLSKLKTFIASYPAVPGPPNLVMAINIDKVTLGGVAGNALLSARMVTDATGAAPAGAHNIASGAPFAFGTPATGITIQEELTLVQ